MLRHSLIVTISPLVFLGCASSRAALESSPAIDAPASALRAEARLHETGLEVGEASDVLAPAPREAEARPVASHPDFSPPALTQDEGDEGDLHGSRFTIKGGYYGSSEDALDDGFIGALSWMRFMSNWLAIEFEVGYLDADGDEGGIETEVWGAPIMVNGRFNVPVWILDLYAGLGIGTLYYDAEVEGGAQEVGDDGWLFAGNGFVGATVNLAEAIAMGIEGKYFVTDETDLDTGLDAFAVMLTLGFSR